MFSLLGTFFILHGLAHLVGFLIPWHFVDPDDGPYKTTVLCGSWDVGSTGIRLVGILWLLGAIAFVAAGTALIRDVAWWQQLALAAAVYSLMMSILSWPDSRVGVYINVVILAVFVLVAAL